MILDKLPEFRMYAGQLKPTKFQQSFLGKEAQFEELVPAVSANSRHAPAVAGRHHTSTFLVCLP